MKTPREDRDSVNNGENSITIVASKEFKDRVVAKSKEMGISYSCLARMAINEFIKRHEN
jgi:transposase-like protein